MAKHRTLDQIKMLLKDVSAARAKGHTVAQACRKQGISEKSYLRWQAMYEGEPKEVSRQVRELTKVVDRLRTLVEDLSLETQMLRYFAKKC